MAWSIFSDGGGDGAALQWATDFLNMLGAPATVSNIDFVYQWEKSEGGGGKYNPLNQGPVPGNPSLTTTGQQYGGGAADFASWQAGLQGAVDYLHMSNYTQVLAALMRGDGQSAKTALWNSPWASSHYGYGSAWSNASTNGVTPVALGDLGSINNPLQPYNATTNPTVTLSGPELAQQYGFAYSMLTAIPELNKIFSQAVAGQWSSQRFTAALMATT
jgi:hypothetical protein